MDEKVRVVYEADTGDIEQGNKRITRSFGLMKKQADSVSSSGIRKMEKEFGYLEKQLKINNARMDELRRKAAQISGPADTSKESLRLEKLTADLTRYQQQQSQLSANIANPQMPDVSKDTAALQKYADQMDAISAKIEPIKQQMADMQAWPQTGEGASIIQEELAGLQSQYDELVAKIDQVGESYAAMEDTIASKQAIAKAAEKDREKLEQVNLQIKKAQMEISTLQSTVEAKGLLGAGTEKDRAALAQLNLQMQNTDLQAQKIRDAR